MHLIYRLIDRVPSFQNREEPSNERQRDLMRKQIAHTKLKTEPLNPPLKTVFKTVCKTQFRVE